MANTLPLIDPAVVHRGDPRVIEDMIVSSSAILSGHFELLSGLHSDRFLTFSSIARDAAFLSRVGDLLFPDVAAQQPDLVLAPSTAGVALGWTLACRLGVPLHLASLDESGRPDGVLGEPELADKRALLVNDVVTTGRSFQALAELIRARDGSVACAAWFMTRSDTDVAKLLDVPGASVLTLPLEAWDAEGCELCRGNVPLSPALDLN
jgi:orotate phosphoribosyltransferase